MPELPEVEVTKMGIAPALEQQTIAKICIHFPKLRWPIPSILETLTGESIVSVTRRAKYLLLEVSQGYIVIHLGMSGHLRVLEQPTPRGKHDHVELWLSDGTCLRYHDPRRFGAWLWIEKSDLATHPLLVKLAPEPLSVAFDATYLAKALQGRRKAIKTCLMDQNLVVGVGNIYANEVLFQVGIHPEMPALLVSKAQCQALVLAIKATLKKAIAQGGTSLKDFSQADGKPGYFKQALAVYGRKGKACVQCSASIAEIKLSQRATFFCVQCQPAQTSQAS